LWGGRDAEQTAYNGADMTGFQSPAQDHLEHVIALARALDLQKPGIYGKHLGAIGGLPAKAGYRDQLKILPRVGRRFS
jgi:hypothetical protein